MKIINKKTFRKIGVVWYMYLCVHIVMAALLIYVIGSTCIGNNKAQGEEVRCIDYKYSRNFQFKGRTISDVRLVSVHNYNFRDEEIEKILYEKLKKFVPNLPEGEIDLEICCNCEVGAVTLTITQEHDRILRYLKEK